MNESEKNRNPALTVDDLRKQVAKLEMEVAELKVKLLKQKEQVPSYALALALGARRLRR
jgi:hypothetical protein